MLKNIINYLTYTNMSSFLYWYHIRCTLWDRTMLMPRPGSLLLWTGRWRETVRARKSVTLSCCQLWKNWWLVRSAWHSRYRCSWYSHVCYCCLFPCCGVWTISSSLFLPANSVWLRPSPSQWTLLCVRCQWFQFCEELNEVLWWLCQDPWVPSLVFFFSSLFLLFTSVGIQSEQI